MTLLMLWVESLSGYWPLGGLVFQGLFVPTAIVLLFVARGLGHRLSEHRCNQMLASVFLTGAKARDLFLAQIGARVLAAIYVALAILPCLCISILYGGASKERCIAAALFVVLEVIFLVALEFFGPAIASDPGAAGLITNIAIGVLALWPWVVDRISLVLAGSGLPRWIYSFSPVTAFLQVFKGFTRASQFREFLLTCGMVSAISLATLFLSAWILSETWREDDHPLLRFAAARRLVHLTRDWQRKWAKTIQLKIESDPLLWMAAFDLRSVRYAWISIVITMALWCAGFAAWRENWLVPGIFYLAAALAGYGVYLQMLLRAANRFSESRHNQFFDSMLAANYRPDQIIEAEEAAIFLQFKTVMLAARAITLLLVIAATFTRTWTGITFIEHVVISATLVWATFVRPRTSLARTMWIALNTGSGVGSVFRRSSALLVNFAYQFYRIISTGAVYLGRFPSGSRMEAFLVLFICPIIWLVAWATSHEYRSAHERIANYFREILQAPIPSAKVIAKWDTQKPLT